MERYFEAKRRLFAGPAPPPAAVNVGDPYGRRLADELATRTARRSLTFGLADDAEVRPDELELDGRGARFTAGGIELETRLRGRFNVENVLGAVAAALLLDVSTRRDRRGRRGGRRACPAASRRSTRASRSRSSSTTRTSPTRSRTSCAPRASSRPAA